MIIIKIILAIVVLLLSGYGLFNPSIDMTSITLLLLGALLLTMGREEIKKEKKTVGYLLIIVAFFNIFVSVQDFLLS
ncbi:DUF3953 domain-containing protein [Oceanobacillus bengalensis]|uniref:DUF3953 domain-containing protein n=1 Tax=Oceanobacillus bengalensis TaxID=1435466 RepID=UPI0016010639|nr:DUF3953 domain-containing protein [Oceanobacillus bengalensis]